MVASLLRGQFAWRPLYGVQLSRGQFAAVSCRVPKNKLDGLNEDIELITTNNNLWHHF